MSINRYLISSTLKINTLFVLTFTLNGCWSTYVQPVKPDSAKINIINDSPDMTIVLSTFGDGVTCAGTQFFTIPKEMRAPKANMDSHLKASGEFQTLIDADKPFSLSFNGISGNPKFVTYCNIITTLQTVSKNGNYEYHYNYSPESNQCNVHLLELAASNKTIVKSPQFINRRSRASALHADSACE